MPQWQSCWGDSGAKGNNEEGDGSGDDLLLRMHRDLRTPGGSQPRERHRAHDSCPSGPAQSHRSEHGLPEGVTSPEGGGEIVERGLLAGAQ